MKNWESKSNKEIDLGSETPSVGMYTKYYENYYFSCEEDAGGYGYVSCA